MVATILLVFAFVLAVLAAIQWPPIQNRVALGWAAFAFYVAAVLFGKIGLGG